MKTFISEVEIHENKKVFEIENVIPPTESNGFYASLPPNANLKKIFTWIVQSPQIPLSSATFTNLMADNHIEALISDGFWYFLCYYFKKHKYPELEKELLNRISSNFVSFYLFYKQEDYPLRDRVMPQIFDVLSQAVFYLLYLSYPKSRNQFTFEVITSICKTFFTLLNGIPASEPNINHWILEMGNINVIKNIRASTMISRNRYYPQYSKSN
jgi:hypothetical protein